MFQHFRIASRSLDSYLPHSHLIGVRQTQWANELETPRTDTAHTEPWYEADPTDEDYLDDGTPGYTYAASQGYPVSEGMAIPC